jgi:hypothetical protein
MTNEEFDALQVGDEVERGDCVRCVVSIESRRVVACDHFGRLTINSSNVDQFRVVSKVMSRERFPKRTPLVYPPELMGLECAGIAMDRHKRWWAFRGQPSAKGVVWAEGLSAFLLSKDFVPCIQHLSAQVAEQGIDWRQTWIAKPEVKS